MTNQMSVPNDDDPQNYKELVEACLLDMERYSTDETSHRIMVSVRSYRERFDLILAIEAELNVQGRETDGKR